MHRGDRVQNRIEERWWWWGGGVKVHLKKQSKTPEMKVPWTGLHQKAARGQAAADLARAETGQMKSCALGTGYTRASLEPAVWMELLQICATHSRYMRIPGLWWNWTEIRLSGCSSLSALRIVPHTKDGCLSCMVLAVSPYRDVSIQSSCQACRSSVWGFKMQQQTNYLFIPADRHSSFLLLLLWHNAKSHLSTSSHWWHTRADIIIPFDS